MDGASIWNLSIVVAVAPSVETERKKEKPVFIQRRATEHYRLC